MTTSNPSSACPSCGKSASGNFCQHCGSALGGRFCNQCGSSLQAAASFCNQCGTQVGAAPRGAAGSGVPGPRRQAAAAAVSGPYLAWWIAGVAMFILIVVVGRSMVRPAGPVAGNAPAAAPATEAAPGTPPDLSSMTPLEAADRLFNRVMQSASSGDSAQIEAFLPMAVAAYERARPLNLDGLFHLSLLNRTGGALDAALNAADEILQQDPNHLLGLAAAAEASAALGQASVAETHYRRILEIYDTESASGREEYSMHAGILNTLKTEAETFLSTR